MTDLFAFGSAAKSLDAEGRYGTAGDLKKTQYVMQLLGFPGDADTLKALIVAGEKGIEIESGILDITQGIEKTKDYLTISPLGITPALKEAHYQVTGDLGIISFIEGRGLGNRLPPRNAALLAEQNYWIDIARAEVAPHVQTIMAEKVFNAMNDDAKEMDIEAVDNARQALSAPLNALDTQLAGKAFIVGEYCYADVHWTAYLHLLYVAGEQALIDQRDNLSQWWERIRLHKSFSGQNLIAYNLLPSLEDIKAKKLNDVVITDF
ncbi:MAG: glutathione S-transferase family protein [Candidatus Thiodiazotropha sp. (ex Cardiolucina cf. quadrata)]|nr:glutathione S-transferase family protein [Candidatus Thiodiazotropha sp. (ex Cardiolucina cf. quadrata)]